MSTNSLESEGRSESAPHVLVVEDEKVTRLLAAHSLATAGFRVTEAENGIEALKTFNEVSPDIVLMDVKMPEMDGFEACESLRQAPRGLHTPVLMMTGLDDVESIERAYEVGATDFVNKPINWLILGHRLEYMLRASRHSEKLRESQAKLATAQRIARLGYWEWHLDSNDLYCSEEMRRIMGTALDDALTDLATFLECVHPADREPLENALAALVDEHDVGEIEFRIVQEGGEVRFVRQRAEALRNAEGRAVLITGAAQDVTETKNAEEKIHFLSYFDGLTGLPNRQSFMERLDAVIAAAEARETLMAILFLDLDRFNRINETLGHAAGDLLLKQVAERISSCVRTTDFVGRPHGELINLVSRFGGDEFVVLLGNLPDIPATAAVARRLSEKVGQPFRIEAKDVYLTTSIGITIFPWDGADAAQLLKNADAAMSQAKQQRGNSCRYYTESMNATALKQLVFEGQLGNAVKRDEFVLYYQPQVDIATGDVVGAEALLRWRHPELGLVEPGRFISIAEENGLIHEIGSWVLRAACRQLEDWRGSDLQGLRMAINLSGRQFSRPDILEAIALALEGEHIDPGLVELELTESVLLQELGGHSLRTLEALKKLGVQLTIDDFGTGYSSLSYLSRLPLDAVKIDRSFIRGLPRARHNAAITRAIIAMAKSLGLRVVAEGVENEEQLAFLCSEGCDEFQGYLFAKPVPAGFFTQILTET